MRSPFFRTGAEELRDGGRGDSSTSSSLPLPFFSSPFSPFLAPNHVLGCVPVHVTRSFVSSFVPLFPFLSLLFSPFLRRAGPLCVFFDSTRGRPPPSSVSLPFPPLPFSSRSHLGGTIFTRRARRVDRFGLSPPFLSLFFSFPLFFFGAWFNSPTAGALASDSVSADKAGYLSYPFPFLSFLPDGNRD